MPSFGNAPNRGKGAGHKVGSVVNNDNRQTEARLYRRSFNFALVGLFYVFMLLGCDTDPGYSSGQELRGVIVNADTGAPIPDAIVVANWITSSGTAGGSELVCFHIGTATTNAAGEYYMPAWRHKSHFSAKFERDIFVYAYKTGYRWQYRFPPEEGYITQYITDKLVPFQGAAKEQLEYLDHVGRNLHCFSGGESKSALLPLQKALLEEARSLATSESDPVVRRMQKIIELTETKVTEVNVPPNGVNETPTRR
jgi:hypothetical protein